MKGFSREEASVEELITGLEGTWIISACTGALIRSACGISSCKDVEILRAVHLWPRLSTPSLHPGSLPHEQALVGACTVSP